MHQSLSAGARFFVLGLRSVLPMSGRQRHRHCQEVYVQLDVSTEVHQIYMRSPWRLCLSAPVGRSRGRPVLDNDSADRHSSCCIACHALWRATSLVVASQAQTPEIPRAKIWSKEVTADQVV